MIDFQYILDNRVPLHLLFKDKFNKSCLFNCTLPYIKNIQVVHRLYK